MEINNVLFEVDLYDILLELRKQLNSNGILMLKDIKESGDNYQTQCPYHKNGQEKRPSGGFKKSDGTFHCFTCGATHSLIEVISYCFGYDDAGSYGFKWLLHNFATISIENRKDIELDVIRGVNRNSTIDNNGFISEQELDSYRYYHPYMYERKLTNEVIEIFDIGWDKNTDCITFPVKDIDGNCLFVARRSVKSKYFNYPSGVRKPIYGLYELNRLSSYPKEVIICESMLDALHFWVVGKYAVALNGLGSDSQYNELSAMPCRKFILCTDNDDAGTKAREVLRRKIKNHIITEYILPSGIKDANDCTDEELNNLKEVF